MTRRFQKQTLFVDRYASVPADTNARIESPFSVRPKQRGPQNVGHVVSANAGNRFRLQLVASAQEIQYLFVGCTWRQIGQSILRQKLSSLQEFEQAMRTKIRSRKHDRAILKVDGGFCPRARKTQRAGSRLLSDLAN